MNVQTQAGNAALGFLEQGDSYRDAGDWARAEAAYRRATELIPEDWEAWAELGCLMADAQRFPEAAGWFQRILPSRGSNGNKAGEAASLLSEIAAARPGWARGQFSLGYIYEHLGDYGKARMHLGNALRLDPSRAAAAESVCARTFWLEGEVGEAVAAADRALQANPNYYLALLIRSKACSAMGRMQEAVENLRRSLEILPDAAIHSDLLFEMNYLAEATPESLYAEACRWNAMYAAPLKAQIEPHRNTPDPERRVRLGYVSPDLHQHTVMKFVPALFERHDRAQFDVFAYAVGPKSDHISDSVRGLVDRYTAIPGSYGELATRVREDGIDILIDLAGHTMGRALLAFALKPAPVQVSWMGYAGTTGMPAMDYYLGDAHMPCPGTERCFSEKVYRLPRPESCFRPVGDVAIAPAPAMERGYITFGCFNNPRKITRQVVMLWSAILHLVRGSRLLLKFHRLERQDCQARLRGWFLEDGIAPERIEFEGQSAPDEYLAAYNRIDIALDPFPYNGGTTTLDALWMGVPVVNLTGPVAAQRAGASILAAAGWPDLVAQTPEQYLNIALYLAATVSKEPELRGDIRKALLASAWMDEIGLVRSVEAAFREMWRAWCRERSGGHVS